MSGGLDPLDVGQQVRQRPLAAQPVGRERRQGAEVGVGVDGDRAQSEPVGEQRSDDEGAGRLAHAALGADDRHHVGAAHLGLLGK